MIVDILRKLIADSYVLYFKAHSFHWNVEGPDFVQYHDFLKNFYEEVFESIDTYAELIRTTDQYAPTSLSRLLDLTSLEEASSIPEAVMMIKILAKDNEVFLLSLKNAYQQAEQTGELGISNYLQDRIQAHEKHAWMLKAIIK